MIILPVYATKQLAPTISRCLASIRNVTDEPLCIVDDASPYPIEYTPVLMDMVIYNPRNEGYTKAVNTGLKFARTTRATTFIVGNDDLYFKEGDLDWIKHIENNEIVSPKTSDEGEGDYFGSIWGMNLETFNTVGLLDEKMKHFFSDTEYYYRAKKAGIAIRKIPDVIIEHTGTATYNTMEKKNEWYEEDKKYYDTLNLG